MSLPAAARNWGVIQDGATFERLVHGLVWAADPHAHLFGRPGPDAGQDARSGDGTRVYQAKFIQNGNFADAMGAARKELDKIKKYRDESHKNAAHWQGVTAWCLVTNARLNPNNLAKWENEIEKPLKELGITATLWSGETIDQKLQENPELDRVFFNGESRVFYYFHELLNNHRQEERSLLGVLGIEDALEHADGADTERVIPWFERKDAESAVHAFLASDKRVLVLTGAHGSGKTRLLLEVAGDVAAPHAAVVGASGTGAQPTIANTNASETGAQPTVTGAGASETGAQPAIASEGAGVTSASAPTWQVFGVNLATAAHTQNLFERLHSERPVLLLIDPLYDNIVELDGFLAQFVEQIRTSSCRWKAIVTVTSRSHFGLAPLRRPIFASNVEDFELRPLTPDEARSFVRHLLDTYPLSGVDRDRLITELPQRFGHIPLWLLIAVHHLRRHSDVKHLPRDTAALAAFVLQDFRAQLNTLATDLSPDTLWELLRWVALLGTVPRDDPATEQFLCDRLAVRRPVSLRAALQTLATANLLTAYPLSNRPVALTPSLIADHLLATWLSADTGLPDRECSAAALDVFDVLRDLLKEIHFISVISVIAERLARIEIQLRQASRPLPIASTLLSGLIEEVRRWTAFMRIAGCHCLAPLAFADPQAGIRWAKALLAAPVADEVISPDVHWNSANGAPFFMAMVSACASNSDPHHHRTLGQAAVIQALGPVLVMILSGAVDRDADIRCEALETLCEVVTAAGEAADAHASSHRPAQGRSIAESMASSTAPAAVLCSIVNENAHFGEIYRALIAERADALLADLAEPMPVTVSLLLLNLIVAPLLALERERHGVDEEGSMTRERRFIAPGDPERKRRLDCIWAALRSPATAPANRPSLWRLFQAAQEPVATRLPKVIEIFRDVPPSEADLQAAAPLWVEDAFRDPATQCLPPEPSRDEGVHEARTALDGYLVPRDTSIPFAALRRRFTPPTEAEQRDVAAFAEALARAPDSSRAIDAFLATVARVNTRLAQTPVWYGVAPVAAHLGAIAATHPTVQAFVHAALASPQASNERLNMGHLIAATWVDAVRQHDPVEARSLVHDLLARCIDNASGRAALLKALYKRDVVGTEAELALVWEYRSDFTDAADLATIFARQPWGHVAPYASALNDLLAALPAADRHRGFEAWVEHVAIAAELSPNHTFPNELGILLLTGLRDVANLGAPDTDLTRRLDALFARHCERPSLSWLVAALEYRAGIAAAPGASREFQVVSSTASVSHFVAPLGPDTWNDPVQCGALDALLDLAKPGGPLRWSLPIVMCDLDPEGTHAARAVATKLSDITREMRGRARSDAERNHVLALACVAGRYLLGGDPWRMIAERAVQTLRCGAVVSEQRDLWKVLAPQVASGFRSVPTDIASLEALRDAVRAFAESESNEQLRPFWAWRLAELGADHGAITRHDEAVVEASEYGLAPPERTLGA